MDLIKNEHNDWHDSYAIIAILFVYRLGDIWPFFIIMPIVMFIFYKIHDHYKKVAEQLRLENDAKLHDIITDRTCVIQRTDIHPCHIPN